MLLSEEKRPLFLTGDGNSEAFWSRLPPQKKAKSDFSFSSNFELFFFAFFRPVIPVGRGILSFVAPGEQPPRGLTAVGGLSGTFLRRSGL